MFPFATDHTVSATDDRAQSGIVSPNLRKIGLQRREKPTFGIKHVGFEVPSSQFRANFTRGRFLNFNLPARRFRVGY